MPRYRLLVEYDGTGFVGWQRQAEGASVQGTLEEAIARFVQTSVTTQVAGRTDAGVHARGQVAHVDLAEFWDPFVVQQALNAYLRDILNPQTISIREVAEVSDTFHARFSAKNRRYCYRILNRRSPSPLLRTTTWHVYAPLDLEKMKLGAELLIGTHDFTSFRAQECQSLSPIKTLDELSFSKNGDLIEIWVEARSFLHHQVRNIVGSLVWVGRGKWTPEHIQRALDAKDRRAGGPTAPASGLCLEHVSYE